MGRTHLVALLLLAELACVTPQRSPCAEQSSAFSASEPVRRYRLGQKLAETHENAGALHEYVWCLDNGVAIDSSFVGVHHTYLLSSIADLGKTYPPAHELLLTRQRSLTARILAGQADEDEVTVYVEVSRVLHDAEAPFSLYLRVLGDRPNAEQIVSLWRLVIEDLLEAGRFAEISSNIATTKRYLETALSQEAGLRRMADQYGGPSPPPSGRALGVAAAEYRALLETESTETVDFAEFVLERDGSKQAFLALIVEAKHKGAEQEVRRLMDRARAVLSAEDTRWLENGVEGEP